MPHIEFTPSSTPDDSAFYPSEPCTHCVEAHESIATVRELMKVFARRRNIRGNDLRTLVRAASDILHNITYPPKNRECTCNSLS